jgi:predicted SAM-dependent methyltransferase
MLSRKAKETFYKVTGPFMWINGLIYRAFRTPKGGVLKAHLGPGRNRYIEGWINIDANMFTGKCDLWADLRNPLPFPDNSVDAIYSHHMIEHLPDIEAHLKDVFRCLKPGGTYRVGGPNGDSAIAKFVANDDPAWFSDFPDKRKSIGGRLENFIFCRGEHLTILTQSFLEELLDEAGFIPVHSCEVARVTTRSDLFDDCLAMEDESDYQMPHTLILEGGKPGSLEESH